jgi:hypothetical protein
LIGTHPKEQTTKTKRDVTQENIPKHLNKDKNPLPILTEANNYHPCLDPNEPNNEVNPKHYPEKPPRKSFRFTM